MLTASTHSLVRSLMAASMAIVALAGTVSADTVTFVPTQLSNNVFPFGFERYAGEYQQVYRAGAFPSAITLRSATFTASPDFLNGATTVTSSLSLGLTTTQAGPASLSWRFDDNRGPSFVPVFTGVVTGVAAEPFSFRIAFDKPFVYRPSAGNLLLDVFIKGNVTTDGRSLPFAFGPSPDMGRVFHGSGDGPVYVGANEGLLTRFEGTAPVPEPGTLLLVATGGAAIGRRAWRRTPQRRSAI